MSEDKKKLSKHNLIEKRLLGYLKGARALDKRENILPPPQTDEHELTMDEMQKLKEGEIADADCLISPAYGGY